MGQSKDELCPKQDFHKIKKLGLGKYARVYLCRRKSEGEHGRQYAMKEVRMNTGCHNDYLVRERDLLILCKESPFIVNLCCAFQAPRDKKAFLILELGAGGDLYELHEDVHLFNEVEARFYLAEMICGLEFLHDRAIIHRDVKGENILLSGTGHVMLCDLGLARQLEGAGDRARTFCGTLSYMSPEMVRRQRYTTKTDVWSLGVLLAFLVTGEEPILGNSEDEKQSNILKGRYHLSCIAKMSYACKNLISQMLRVNQDQRPSVGDLKTRRFLNKLDWASVSSGGLQPPYQPRLGRKVRRSGAGQLLPPSKSRADSQFRFHGDSDRQSSASSHSARVDSEESSPELEGFDWVSPELLASGDGPLTDAVTQLSLDDQAVDDAADAVAVVAVAAVASPSSAIVEFEHEVGQRLSDLAR